MRRRNAPRLTININMAHNLSEPKGALRNSDRNTNMLGRMIIRLSESPPVPPENVDFGFTIDFKKGEGNPRRVFDAASALIGAFGALDDALVRSVDSDIEPVMVLEDVETGSLKVWLRNILQRADDEAIKELDWKKHVGKYLVRAKYITLEFLDDNRKGRLGLEDLRYALRKLAEETDVKHLPDYPPPHEGRLVSALDKIQRAKTELGPGDRLTIETEDKTYEVNLGSTWIPSKEIEQPDVRETTSDAELILVVRKPDMLKDTMWQFSHGKTNVSAPILDEEWLESYHRREIAILPGDALRCAVKFKYTYDDKGVLIDSDMDIVKVLEVISGDRGGRQTSLFE